MIWFALFACGGAGSEGTDAAEPSEDAASTAPKAAWQQIQDGDDGIMGNVMEQQARARPPNFGSGTKQPFVAVLARPGHFLDTIEVTASTVPLTCEQWHEARGKETSLHLTLSRRPTAGALTWSLDKAAWTHWKSTFGSPVTGEVHQVDANEGGTVRLQVEVAFAGTSWEKPWMHVDDTLQATMCSGEAPTFPEPRLQKEVMLTVEGMELPVQGALVEQTKEGDRLVLSTQPLACGQRGRGWIDLMFSERAFGAQGAWLTTFGTRVGEHTIGEETGELRSYTVKAEKQVRLGTKLAFEVQGSGTALYCPR